MEASWFERIARAVPEVRYPPSACTREELMMLSYITQYLYRGTGAVCDLGCGKGGSTFALYDGLSRNPRGGPGTQVHAYDWFEHGTGSHSDGDAATFWNNVRPFKDLITLHVGDLLDETWNGGEIAVLFVDIAKELNLFKHVVAEFFPALVPGVSVIIHQDFGRPRLPWLHYSTGVLLPFVEVLGVVQDSLVLKLARPIDDEVYRAVVTDDFSTDTQISEVRKVQSMLGNEVSRGFSYREILGLSEAFVHYYAGDTDTARETIDRLAASDKFMDHFRPMMKPILHS